MKKKFFIFILSVLLCSAAIAPTVASARAENSLPLNRIGGDGYYHFESITSLYFDEYLYVSDKNGTVVFKDEPEVLPYPSLKNFAVMESFFAQQPDGIHKDGALFISGEFTDFCLTRECVYAARGKEIFVHDKITGEQLSSVEISGDVLGLAADGDNVYYYYAREYDEFTLGKIIDGNKKLDFIFNRFNGLKDICAGGGVYLLNDKCVEKYTDDGNKLSLASSADVTGGNRIAAGDGCVYLATANGEIRLVRENDSYTVFASKSDGRFFYNEPHGLASGLGKLYVADTFNNRIAVFENNDVSYIDDTIIDGLICPTAVAADSAGNLYAAHSSNLITRYSDGGEKTIAIENDYLYVENMRVDSDDNLYILAKDLMTDEYCVYRSKAGFNAIEKLDFDNPRSLGYKAGGEVLIYDGAIKTVDGKIYAESEPLNDFSVDYSGKIFGLDQNGVFVTIGSETVRHAELGDFTRMILSSAANGFVGTNDIVLLDESSHSLYKIDAAAAGVAKVTDFYTVPDAENDRNPFKQTDRFISKATRAVPLYAQPAESDIVFTAQKDSVLFIDYTVKTPDEFYFAAAEDVASKKLRFGYVYKTAVGKPLPYENPENKLGAAALDLSVYKYPTTLGKKIIAELPKKQTVQILPFAVNHIDGLGQNCYKDATGTSWLRIAMENGCEGYVLAGEVSFTLFNTVENLIKDNATVTGDAMVYTYSNGEYVSLDYDYNVLKKGTRVQIDTPFDSSNKYTKVLFFIEGKGTIDIDCYIETRFVDFDGVDILKIVAICAIIVTVILLILLIVKVAQRRKRRYVN